eukprot:RCo020300
MQSVREDGWSVSFLSVLVSCLFSCECFGMFAFRSEYRLPPQSVGFPGPPTVEAKRNEAKEGLLDVKPLFCVCVYAVTRFAEAERLSGLSFGVWLLMAHMRRVRHSVRHPRFAVVLFFVWAKKKKRSDNKDVS